MTTREAATFSAAARPLIYTRTDVAMDTLISVRIDTARPEHAAVAALERALRWFAVVEGACSRFGEGSELVRLSSRPCRAVPVSRILLETVAFALEVARLTDGRFDPTIGAWQQRRGWDRNYLTDRPTAVALISASEPVSYRDVTLDRAACTITLARPLLLDLGAVAKGFAIDLAARELAGFERFAVDAGGDLYGGGADEAASPWRVGIRHPRTDSGFLESVTVMNASVCTSGDYERPGAGAGEHHILDPRTGRSPRGMQSATVLAPTAMVAGALATASFVLGPVHGLKLLVEQGAGGLLALRDGTICTTPGFEEHLV